MFGILCYELTYPNRIILNMYCCKLTSCLTVEVDVRNLGQQCLNLKLNEKHHHGHYFA